MTLFRPCIDLHEGKVKQIVGSSLSDSGSNLQTNFESEYSAAYFAELYKKDELFGGHVIMLGKGNEIEAKSALAAHPQGLQIGGGISPKNAEEYLNAGASHVIVTSYLFENEEFSEKRLEEMKSAVGKERLVLDLSCKKTAAGWNIATNRWQTVTSTIISKDSLAFFANYCDEFLIHAADVEGKQQGMDEELIRFLAEYSPIKATYAGGARHLNDLKRCLEISMGKIDLTIGSALDIFGGSGARYAECVEFNRMNKNESL
jgi:phosphoribosylformimino-5-aminoimidazole carboxamide ribotide isomerase